MSNWSLYLLENSDNKRTYLGVSNDVEKRIKKHNGILSGGAKYTASNKGDGEWILKTLVPNLTKSESLSFERIIKNKRRQGKGKTPLERRNYLIDLIVKNFKIIKY